MKLERLMRLKILMFEYIMKLKLKLSRKVTDVP